MNYKEVYTAMVNAANDGNALIIHPEIIGWISKGGDVNVNVVVGEALKADIEAALAKGEMVVRQPRSLGSEETETKWLKSMVAERPDLAEFMSIRRGLLPIHESATKVAAGATLAKAGNLLKARMAELAKKA